jgi:hypothetical protein
MLKSFVAPLLELDKLLLNLEDGVHVERPDVQIHGKK